MFARVCVCEAFLDLTQPTVRTDSYNTADQSCLQVDHLLSFCAALHLAKTLSTVISEEARFVLFSLKKEAEVTKRTSSLLN